MSELACMSIRFGLLCLLTCDTPHIAAALHEYCISFHCTLVNQDFPLHATRERKRLWLSVCRPKHLPSKAPRNNRRSRLNLAHYFVVFRKVAKSGGDQARRRGAGARDDRMISRDLMGSDCSVICHRIQRDPLFNT